MNSRDVANACDDEYTLSQRNSDLRGARLWLCALLNETIYTRIKY